MVAETGKDGSVGDDVGDGIDESTLSVEPGAGVELGEGGASAGISGVGCCCSDGVGDSPSLGDAEGEGNACVAVTVSVLVAAAEVAVDVLVPGRVVGVWDGSVPGVSGA